MSIILLIIIGFSLLFFFKTKNTIIHELLYIPNFWIRNLSVQKDNLISKKIKFGKHRQQYFIFCQPKKNVPLKKHVILYFHGGGYVLGGIESRDAALQFFAAEMGVKIFSLDYRLAPENKFPSSLQDANLALEWLGKELDTTERAASMLKGREKRVISWVVNTSARRSPCQTVPRAIN